MHVVECDASMRAIDVGKASRLLEKSGGGPESTFLQVMEKLADDAIDDGRETDGIEIPKDQCRFSGNYAGTDQLTPIAGMIAGRLSGYFVGEDGTVGDGFIISNGVLEKCTPDVVLMPQSGYDATLVSLHRAYAQYLKWQVNGTPETFCDLAKDELPK